MEGMLQSKVYGNLSNGLTVVPAQLGGTCAGCDTPNAAFDTHQADVVTLTVGADDIHFSDWLTKCYVTDNFPDLTTPGACGTTADQSQINSDLATAKGNLRLVLSELNRRAVGAGKTLKVLVTNYYNPLPTSYNSSCIDVKSPDFPTTGVGLEEGEYNWINSNFATLNSNIQSEVTYAHGNDTSLDVRLVDVSQIMHTQGSPDGRDHSFCSTDAGGPWAYGPSIAYTNYDLFYHTPFHPTPDGQRAIYEAVKSVLTDTTAPTVGTPTWSANPVSLGSNATLTVPAADAQSGVAGGEYYIGNDPGVGHGTAMTYGSGNLTATLGSSLAAGNYTVGIRSRDVANNWSSVTTTTLMVRNSSGGADYVTNGTFESGNATGWHDGISNATPGVTTSQAHSGTHSMTFTGSFDVTDSPNGINTQNVDTVQADFWVKGPAGKTIQPYLRQYLTDGNNTMFQSFTMSGGWDHIVTNALHLYGPTASDYDSTKPGVDFNINDPSAGSSDTFYIDDIHEYGNLATETCGFQNLMSSLVGDAIENCGGEAPYGTQYWNTNGSSGSGSTLPTLTSDTSDAHDGLYSFKLVANTSGTVLLNDSPNARTVGEVPASDTNCTTTAWMKTPNTSGRTLKLKLQEYQGSTNEGSNTYSLTPNGSWQQLSVTYTLSSAHTNGNSTLDLWAYMTGAATGDVLRVDHLTSTCQ